MPMLPRPGHKRAAVGMSMHGDDDDNHDGCMSPSFAAANPSSKYR